MKKHLLFKKADGLNNILGFDPIFCPGKNMSYSSVSVYSCIVTEELEEEKNNCRQLQFGRVAKGWEEDMRRF